MQDTESDFLQALSIEVWQADIGLSDWKEAFGVAPAEKADICSFAGAQSAHERYSGRRARNESSTIILGEFFLMTGTSGISRCRARSPLTALNFLEQWQMKFCEDVLIWDPGHLWSLFQDHEEQVTLAIDEVSFPKETRRL